MNKDDVVLTWLLRGIEDFFMVFNLEELSLPSRYRPFFCAMGYEMFCKSYLLGTRASEYESLLQQQAANRVNSIAKGFGHNLCNLTALVGNSLCDVEVVLKQRFHKWTGSELLKNLEKAYLESRYPVPNPAHKNYKIKEGMYHDVLGSSDLRKFCYAFGRVVLAGVQQNFQITIPKERLDARLKGEVGRRFAVIFFGDNSDR